MSKKSERTREEREAARRERERKRAEREGRPIPPDAVEPPAEQAAPVDPEPPVVEPPAADEAAAAPFDAHVPDAEPPASADAPQPEAADPPVPADDAHDPQATQQWDASVDWTDDHPAVEPPAAAEPQPDPAAAHEQAAAHEPEPEPGREPEPAEPHTEATPPLGPPAPAPASSDSEEVPLGIRRVRGQRPSLPHVRRRTRGRPRVRRPGELGPPRRRTTTGGRIAGVVVALLVIAAGWFLISLFQPFGGGGDGSGRVVVRIPDGASAGDIGKLLADRGVVSSGFFFNVRATVGGDRSDLKSGRYTLRRDMSYAAALDALTENAAAAEAPPTVDVTIPEGRSRRETAPIARRAGLRGGYFVATRRSRQLNPRRYGAPAGSTLEGFLFPATYELRRGARVQRLVDDQLAAFKRNFATVDLGYARSKNLTAYDVLTIASMIEREVSVARERPLVAAVIYNRLNQGIPLGIDATLRFEQNDWVNPLRQSVLDADTPFNTRIRAGLPPGPIGSPGLASIKAAARPARVGYTYYVVDPCKNGEHAFANTYDQHLANVARYDRAREAAGGRGLRC